MTTLRLPNAGVVGHKACFHRRGRDLTPLMFRIALLLRTSHGEGLIDGDDFLQHVPTVDPVGEPQEAVDILRIQGESDVAGAPRTMAVRRRGIWIVLCKDGWMAGGNLVVDAADLWRSGASVERIAVFAEDLRN